MGGQKYPVTLAEQGRKLGVSRQRVWQLQRTAEGLCQQCGVNPRSEHSTAFCVECQDSNRERNRKRIGSQPWRPGGPGRPPIGLLTNNRVRATVSDVTNGVEK